MKSATDQFPFKCVFSLSPLVARWNQFMSNGDTIQAAFAKRIQEELRSAPELLSPIGDLSVVEKRKDLVDMLMSIVFPPTFWDRDYSAAFLPFHLQQSFYWTPPFKRFFLSENGVFEGLANLDQKTMARWRVLTGYFLVLKSHVLFEMVWS